MTTLLKSLTVKLRGCDPSRVVLRYFPGEVDTFAVHTEVFPPEEGREAFFIDGGYHRDFESAVAEFGERAKRDIKRAVRENEQDERLLGDVAAA